MTIATCSKCPTGGYSHKLKRCRHGHCNPQKKRDAFDVWKTGFGLICPFNKWRQAILDRKAS